jgi:hypothetical protein
MSNGNANANANANATNTTRRMEEYITSLTDNIDIHILSYNISNQLEDTIMKDIVRFHSIIKQIPIKEASIVSNTFSKYPTFASRMADFVMSSPSIVEKRGHLGLAFVFQSLMDKGVQKDHLILPPNHSFKCALRHYLQSSKNEFENMDAENKKKFTTVWEVYADLYPEEEDMVMLLENMGYYN